MKHSSFSVALPIGLAALVGVAVSALAGSAQTATRPGGPVIVVGISVLDQKLAHDMAGNGARIVTLDSAGIITPQSNLNAAHKSSTVPQTAPGANSFLHDGTITAQRYFITDLGTLGGTESFAYAVNDYGQVVGTSRMPGDFTTHSFLYANGKMTDLYPLNSQGVQTVGPSSINNAGQIASGVIVDGVYVPAILDSVTGNLTLIGSLGGVADFLFAGVATSINDEGNATGYSYLDNLNRHGFLYSDNVMTDIGSFGGYSAGLAINDENEIAGFASDTYNGAAHAFVYSDGVMTDLDSDTESYAEGINNRGQVVGHFFHIPDGDHAFLYSQGNFTDLGLAGSPETVAYAINNDGQIVGTTFIAGKERAFIFENAAIVDLNSLIPQDFGWELTDAFDVNHQGQIVGYGVVNDKFRAYLLTPATSADQCTEDAWMRFGFKNQGLCVRYVNTGK